MQKIYTYQISWEKRRMAGHHCLFMSTEAAKFEYGRN